MFYFWVCDLFGFDCLFDFWLAVWFVFRYFRLFWGVSFVGACVDWLVCLFYLFEAADAYCAVLIVVLLSSWVYLNWDWVGVGSSLLFKLFVVNGAYFGFRVLTVFLIVLVYFCFLFDRLLMCCFDLGFLFDFLVLILSWALLEF